MQFREAIDRDVQDLWDLAGRIAASTGESRVMADLRARLPDRSKDFAAQEGELEGAAWALRKGWLGLAHRPADALPKSPCAGQRAHLACGDDLSFGYDRELDPSALEARGLDYMPRPAGWARDLVLFRSGQAALSGLLQLAISRWGERGPHTIAHAGAYYETAAWLERWPERILRRCGGTDAEADLVIAEPVWCDGRFGRAVRLPKPRRALLLDTTMVGPSYDIGPHLQESCPLVAAYSSGLKLDQAGLELANVGIVRLFGRDPAELAAVAPGLREIRGLTGSGLTFDEASALSAPWFMDRAYADRYTAAVFAHNRALAQAVGGGSGVFGSRCHPSPHDDGASAPFCALTLNEPSAASYRRLAEIVERESDRRRLHLVKGGSFGFRSHRFELIEPPPGQGDTFLRVAMGWRDGYSREGLCELFAELAAAPSFAALDRNQARQGR
jgi:hypothetical protein